MSAPSSRRASLAPPPSDINLYCAQCEAQLGIFENEWIRLTSSYARSRKRGTHFGTEVGQRTQVVPTGPMKNSAEGCEMAEVFCVKCSSMVGQYCKRAPDRRKQALVDQYFYKLSRTFLKNSRTNIRVDPIFAYNTDILESTPGARPSVVPRTSHTPNPRWMQTPLREASGTPSVQTVTRSALRAPSIPSTRYGESMVANDETFAQPSADTEKLEQELSAQNSMLRDHSSKIASQKAQISAHEGRLRDHDARVEDQEKCVTVQASRILEQEELIAEQAVMIKDQQSQLDIVTSKLATLQHSMDELTSSMKQIRTANTDSQISALGQSDFITNFEVMLQSMKESQSSFQEVTELRAQNQELQAQLDTVVSAMSAVATSGKSSEGSPSSALRVAQVLGKRKRNDPVDRSPSSALLGTPTTISQPLPQPEKEYLDQVPTPRSSLNDRLSIPLPTLPTESIPVNKQRSLTQTEAEVESSVCVRPLEQSSVLVLPDTESQDRVGLRASPEFHAVVEDRAEALAESQYAYPGLEEDPRESSLQATRNVSSNAWNPSRANVGTVDKNNDIHMSDVSPEAPRHPTTRATIKLAQQNSNQVQTQAQSTEHGSIGGLEPAQSEIQTQLDPEGDQDSYLPSVQAASHELGVNLEALQKLSQAFNQRTDEFLTDTPTVQSAQPLAAPGADRNSGNEKMVVVRSSPRHKGDTTDRVTVQVISEHSVSSTPVTTQQAIFVEDTSMFDNVDFSDDDDNLAFGNSEDLPDNAVVTTTTISRDSLRRVTNTWIDREKRSMAPEPARRRKTINGPKYVTLDRMHIATPKLFTDAIVDGRKTKLHKPPPINRRKQDLDDELHRIGMSHWIGKDKKSKEYRNEVAEARARYRNARKSDVLVGRGLNHNSDDLITGLSEQPILEPPSNAASKAILANIENTRSFSAPEIEHVPGNENPTILQPSQDKAANDKSNESPNKNSNLDNTTRLTRSRARRSSASVGVLNANPEVEVEDAPEEVERATKKRKSNVAASRKRESSSRSTAVTGPSESQPEHDITTQKESNTPLKRSGRQEDSLSPSGSRIQRVRMALQAASSPQQSPALSSQPRRKEMPQTLKTPAQIEEEIMARDQLAREAMEREETGQ